MLRLFLFVWVGICFFSCSLEYKEEEVSTSNIPEIIFNDAHYKKYEDGSLRVELTASQLEQYQKDSYLYGTDARFTGYREGKPSLEGQSSAFAGDIAAENFTLVGGAQVSSLEDNTVFKSENIKWQGSSRQVTTGVSDMTEIFKEETDGEVSLIEVAGQGFSASGISQSYEFGGPVTGKLYIKKENEVTENQEGHIREVSGE
ncbi:MAG: LPS export ABC transporter periplasmic protein LptC [Candidatus Treponema excrementipullorum]|nr:LPS export ABC transporter periplasmic protein LptC [Spirochaetia bacterium]MDY4464916.1 LPS export ABC transporter periplasmic protein LptC [Candidatus Treponema excrementipullorum]